MPADRDDAPLTIWCNQPLPQPALARLREGVGLNRLVLPDLAAADNLTAGAPDPAARGADVLYGQPSVEDVVEGRARWVALSSAGYTRYDTESVRKALASRGATLTNASSVYDEPCAQHALAQMLAASRRLPEAIAAQRARRWDSGAVRRGSFLLRGQTAVLVGYGAIAKRLAELLRPFEMTLVGVRRTMRGDEAIRCVTPDEVDALLPQADHVVNILPASGSTEHFFGARRLGLIRAGATYYSIGRGATTDQKALRQVLREGRLGAAYLDVFEPEPPTPDDEVWTCPNLVMTPHSAGGFDGEHAALVDHFLANLRRHEANRPLVDRVQ